MTYSHHTHSQYDDHSLEERDEVRLSYSRSRSYRAERRRRSQKRTSSTPGFTINGRRRRRWTW